MGQIRIYDHAMNLRLRVRVNRLEVGVDRLLEHDEPGGSVNRRVRAIWSRVRQNFAGIRRLFFCWICTKLADMKFDEEPRLLDLREVLSGEVLGLQERE